MKILLPLMMLLSLILVSCSSVSKDAPNANSDIDLNGGTPSVNVTTDSGGDVNVDSSGTSVNAGSGSVDVSTDESLKEIDDIINDIAEDK